MRGVRRAGLGTQSGLRSRHLNCKTSQTSQYLTRLPPPQKKRSTPEPTPKRRSGRAAARGMKEESNKNARACEWWRGGEGRGGEGKKRKGNLSVPSPVPSKQVRRRLNVVPAERVELSRPYGHCALNTACLPIPPCRQAAWPWPSRVCFLSFLSLLPPSSDRRRGLGLVPTGRVELPQPRATTTSK